jgi:hypothetical protein
VGDRTFSGYPFRMDVRLINARVAEPSGWALRAPELNGEANAYDIGHWVIVAPKGVVMTRPINGDVVITGQALRASFAGFDKYPPRISVEGANLVFTPAAGAAPFPLLSTAGLQLHVRPGPDDQGAIFFEAKGAKARFTGLLGRIAADRTADLIWDSKVSKISALHGTSWADAVADWSAAGGSLTVQQGKLNAGEALIEAKSGALTVDDDGRLRGALDVTVREIPTPGQALKQPRSRRRGHRPGPGPRPDPVGHPEVRERPHAPGPVRHGAFAAGVLDSPAGSPRIPLIAGEGRDGLHVGRARIRPCGL